MHAPINGAPCSVVSFYHFHTLFSDEIDRLTYCLEERAKNEGIFGLLLLSEEGINANLAGEKARLQGLIEMYERVHPLPGAHFKWSESSFMPYRRFKVDRRKELITSWDGAPTAERIGEANEGTYLSPEEWQTKLKTSTTPPLIIDTRNDYEWAIGSFSGAVTLEMRHFSEFPSLTEEVTPLPDQDVLLFCTGGVRCEKAVSVFKDRGHQRVYQLHGGILNYLEAYPEGSFEGECFVFDHRVSVTNSLAPSSRYCLCPHCGNPGEKKITCPRCSKEAVVCDKCVSGENGKLTCSKDCEYQFRKRG
jgi:UPF0176 protein